MTVLAFSIHTPIYFFMLSKGNIYRVQWSVTRLLGKEVVKYSSGVSLWTPFLQARSSSKKSLANKRQDARQQKKCVPVTYHSSNFIGRKIVIWSMRRDISYDWIININEIMQPLGDMAERLPFGSSRTVKSPPSLSHLFPALVVLNPLNILQVK